VEWSTLRCEHRACDYCQRRYSWRVTQAIEDTLADEESLHMVTLTQRPAAWGVGVEAGEQCQQSTTDHWRRAVQLARDVLKSNRMYKEWMRSADHDQAGRWIEYWWQKRTKLRKRVRDAVRNNGRPSCEYESTNFAACEEESLTYLWQKECELHLPDETSPAGHYHWHLHVVVPSREVAELLNACWQATREQDDPCQTDISSADTSGRDDTDSEAEAMARELSLYLAGTRSGAFLEEATGWQVRSYFLQLHGTRLYAAGGRWRPIGVTPDQTTDDPVVAVAWADVDEWYSWEDWWSGGQTAAQVAATHGWYMTPQQLVDERPDAFDMPARRVLEQHRKKIPDTRDISSLPTDDLVPPDDLNERIDARDEPDG